MKLWSIFIIALYLAACTSTSNIEVEEIRDYNLVDAEVTLETGDSVSALTAAYYLIGDDYFIVTRNDSPNVMILNSGELLLQESYWFADIRDVKGIVSTGNQVYLLSDSTVYNFTAEGKDLKFNQIINLPFNASALGKSLDAEKIFIVKAEQQVDESFKWDVYHLNIRTNSLADSPAFSIEQLAIREFIDADFLTNLSIELKNYFSYSGNTLIDPIAVAVHPVTNDIYVLSSLNNLLIVYKEDYTIREVAAFDLTILNNPLNLYFKDRGDLFILDKRDDERLGLLQFPFRAENVL